VGKNAATPLVQTNAAIHSYIVAFWWAAGIFALGAIACGLIIKSGKPDPNAAPAVAP
jgi:hypothetical protein